MRLVLALSKPSFTRMRAVASTRLSTVARDRSWVAIFRGLVSGSRDFTFTDGASGRMSREEMPMHVLTHGAGHRGQVSAVMLLQAVAPVRDGFTTCLHEAEAAARRRS